MNPWLFWWDLWELQHKAVFDGLNKLIYISPNVTEIDVRVDLYSAWKQWVILTSDNAKWLAAMRATGGDPLPGGEFLGRTFFLINGWRIVLDHGVNFTGNLYTEEGDTPFVSLEGVEVATSTVSTLVVENTVEATVTAADIAQSVWDTDLSTATTGSAGEALSDLQQAAILATGSVNPGGTAGNSGSSFNTSLTKPDGYFDNNLILVLDGSHIGTRQIDRYYSTGRVDLIEPLPFTPSDTASIVILSIHLANRGSIG